MEAMELEEAMVANQRRDREEALAEEERIDQLKREDEKVKVILDVNCRCTVFNLFTIYFYNMS